MLDFLYTGVSWVLLRWHDLFTFLGLSSAGGLNWSLSIVFLVITARLLLFRFFLKQVHYQRNMQEMQPRLQAIKEKYKNDRQAQQREMMRLQQEEGFNPLAGCLPMLLQIPIFISLFHVLRHLSNSVGLCEAHDYANPKLSLYSFTPTQTCEAAQARLFGAPLGRVVAGHAGGDHPDARRPDRDPSGDHRAGGDQRGGHVLHPDPRSPGRGHRPGRHRRDRAEADAVRHPGQRAVLRPVLPAGGAAVLVHQQHLDDGSTALHQQVPPPRPQRGSPAGELGKTLAPTTRTETGPRRPAHRRPPPETPDGSGAGRPTAAASPTARPAQGAARWRWLRRLRSAPAERTAAGATSEPAGRGEFEPPGWEASEPVEEATVTGP